MYPRTTEFRPSKRGVRLEAPASSNTNEVKTMYYIQRKDQQTRQLETVDQFDNRKEALEMRKEYTLSDSFGVYYISQRACKNWNKEGINHD